MSLDLIKQNIERENKILLEINELEQKKLEYEDQIASGSIVNKTIFESLNKDIDQLVSQIDVLNNALPELINSITFYSKTGESPTAESKKVISVKYNEDSTEKPINVAINKKEHNRFLESITLHNSLKKQLKKVSKEEDSKALENFEGYINISNKLFRNFSNKLVSEGSFSSLRQDLVRITSPLIINSYLSIMFFSTLVAFISGLVIGILLLIFKLGINGLLIAPVILPILTFGLFYIYPSSKRKGLEKEINQELPFLIIYLAAISTSGIEPSKIFQIIVSSNDYPITRREIKKLTNYINFYGYDLVSALKAVSKNCPSERMSQLFDGLSTTITSGGELTTFLNKHSDSLLFDYRLEREKYTRAAETFMNIYISVVIAAPMIMMIIFILMSMGNFGSSIGPSAIGLITIMVISLLNFAFLIFLNMKQPKF